MSGSFSIPKFHSKDFSILLVTMLPMTILLNYLLYKEAYLNRAGMFFATTIVSFCILAIAYMTYGIVAISLLNRFPKNSDSVKRLAICISIFFLMSAVYISLVLTSYDQFHFYNYQYSETDFIKTYTAFMVVNVFLTFLNEGIYRFEQYRDIKKETEQLKKEHLQSQLLGLKSQMNPHFLFNSLNTLSSLIQEDEEKAEEFLDHMSKVYRYLLRNNEEQLVSLQTELNFVHSYYYLLKARHSDGLCLSLEKSPGMMEYMIPPLTLQMILENILAENSVSRSSPLCITIRLQNNKLEVVHSMQRKMNHAGEVGAALENIDNKYRLLCQQQIEIREQNGEKIFALPLIDNTELVTI